MMFRCADHRSDHDGHCCFSFKLLRFSFVCESLHAWESHRSRFLFQSVTYFAARIFSVRVSVRVRVRGIALG